MAETKLGTAQIPIRATLDELDKDLAGVRAHVERALSGVQKHGKIALGGLAAGALAVGGAIATIGPIAIDAASDLSESMNKANVVFGASLKVIDEFAKTSASSFGISKQAAYEATGTFGNLFSALGMAKGPAADMSVDIVKLAADLSSFNNIPTDQALEKLRSGLVGEVEPLRSLGINLTEAQVQAKALAMGLAKTAGALTPAMKVQARYALILEQTTTAQGDFARTSDGLANTQRILSATFKDISADIGTAFLPLVLGVAQAVQPLAKALMPKLAEVLAMLAPIMTDIGASVGIFVDRLMATGDPIGALSDALVNFPDIKATFDDIVAGVQSFLASIQPTIDQVTAWISQNVNLQDVLIALGVAIAAVVIPAIWSVVAAAAPIVAAFIALVAVAALLRQAWTENWGGIRDTLTAFWEGTAKPALTQLWAWLSVNVPKAIQTLSDFWYNTMLPALNAVWTFIQTSILPILATVWMWLAVNVPAAIQTLADFWNNTLLPALDAVWTFIQTNIIPLLAALGNVYLAIVSKAAEALAGLWQNVLLPALTIVWQFIQSNILPILMVLWNFISATLGPVLTWLGENILPAINVAFGAIGTAIGVVIGWLGTLAESINNLKLPSWLTPGSPTPFEQGLTGVSVAAAQASTDLGTLLATAIQHVGNVLRTDLDYWLGDGPGLIGLLKTVATLSGQAMGWAVKYESAFYVMRAAIADAGAAAGGLLESLEGIKAIGTINTWVITHYQDIFEPAIDRSGGGGGAPTGGGEGGATTGGDGACFLAGTPVHVGHDATRPIEEIREGDAAMSFDLDRWEMVMTVVAKKLVHPPTDVRGWVVINGTLCVTPEHPVRANGTWIEAGYLHVGDVLHHIGGNVWVQKLEWVEGSVEVYNLHVENENHCYFAGGILVHNAEAKQHGGPVAAGIAYLVGEKEPEIFVPNMAGRIIPNAQQFMNQLNSAMGRIIQATTASVSASLESMPELVARAGGGAGQSLQQHVTIYGLTLEGVQDARGLLGELQAMT